MSCQSDDVWRIVALEKAFDFGSCLVAVKDGHVAIHEDELEVLAPIEGSLDEVYSLLTI